MQHEPNFTDHMTDHLARRQRPSAIPEDLLDEVDAAALKGASSVDAIADAGRQARAIVDRSAASRALFNRIGDRHGNPLTELWECAHLTAAPIQPRYVYCASPKKVFCEDCLTAFFCEGCLTTFLADGKAIEDYNASTDCYACGTETEVEDLYIENLSNRMVTYLAIKICSNCMAIGP